MPTCCRDAVSFTIEAHAGLHDRGQCPVTFPIPQALPPGKALKLCVEAPDGSCGTEVAVQFCPACAICDCTASLIVDDLPAGQTRRYRAHIVDAPGAGAPGVEVVRATGQVDFRVAGELFTSYLHHTKVARPYCYPVIGPGGVEMTNCGPGDHVHHRSLYIAQGEVNGHDNWSELKGHARTVCDEVTVASQGPVFGSLMASNYWASEGGQPLLAENVVLTVWHLPAEHRVMDWDITWTAAYGGVFFGDTKEAGTLSVRVAEQLEARYTGLITNAYGGVTEAETWGKRAPWCDYSGMLKGQPCGIAILDHPDNFRYPTYWHVRDYGLFTANQWGIHEFTGDWSQRGDHALPAGQSLRFRFRLLIHAGDVQAGRVADSFHNWAHPPQVTIAE